MTLPIRRSVPSMPCSRVRPDRSVSLACAVTTSLCLALVLPGCKNQEGSSGPPPTTSGGPVSIVVGEYGSLTGGTATFGQSSSRGIQLAVDKLNAAGGVLGKTISVDLKDDNSQADQAHTVVESLVNEKVAAVLGEVASSRSLQGAPVCQQAGIPMISPASTNPRVTAVGDYIFRVCYVDPFQGKTIAYIGSNIIHAKRAAVLYDNGQDYSKGLKEYIEQNFKASGGAIVGEFTYSSSDTDFHAQLTSIKADNPDVIFVPGYYTEVAIIGNQARELGITVPLAGGDGWDSPDLTKVAGHSLDGCYFSDHFAADDKNPVVQSFVTAYKAEFNSTPDAMAALGYDAAGVLADALKRAKSTDGEALRAAIAATKNYPGVTGSISVGPDRNAVKPIVILKIVDGKPGFFQRLNP